MRGRLVRRLGKRKRQEREVYAFKGHRTVDTGIFNDETMVYLSKFFDKGIIGRIVFITARGKEADLYLCEPGISETVKGAKFVVLKFFRIETSSFYTMNDYITGDPRFGRMNKSKKSIIKIWCRKEYGNLQIANEAGVNAPTPYLSNGSILAMKFIGSDEGVPAPTLKRSELSNPKKTLKSIIGSVKKLYEKELVHADLSEYNILMKEETPYLIDFGQAVVLRHPNAMMFLRRDINNVLQYFSKQYGIDKDFDRVLEYVTGTRKDYE
jgi:RIO kinase 1